MKIQTDPMKFLALGGDDYLSNFEKNYTESINNFVNYFKDIGINTQ